MIPCGISNIDLIKLQPLCINRIIETIKLYLWFWDKLQWLDEEEGPFMIDCHHVIWPIEALLVPSILKLLLSKAFLKQAHCRLLDKVYCISIFLDNYLHNKMIYISDLYDNIIQNHWRVVTRSFEALIMNKIYSGNYCDNHKNNDADSIFKNSELWQTSLKTVLW